MSKTPVKSEISGKMWKIEAQVGDRVSADDTILILESMKMEIPVLSPCTGVISEIRVSESEAVSEGQLVAVIDG